MSTSFPPRPIKTSSPPTPQIVSPADVPTSTSFPGVPTMSQVSGVLVVALLFAGTGSVVRAVTVAVLPTVDGTLTSSGTIVSNSTLKLAPGANVSMTHSNTSVATVKVQAGSSDREAGTSSSGAWIGSLSFTLNATLGPALKTVTE